MLLNVDKSTVVCITNWTQTKLNYEFRKNLLNYVLFINAGK